MDNALDQDWSDAWDTLPEAPDLVPRPKTAQLTLRVPTNLLTRIKRIAKARSLPYHAMARSWLIDAMRQNGMPPEFEANTEPQAEQFNIKLDQDLLDDLKRRGHDMAMPYHRVAREWIEWETAQAEAALGLDQLPASHPPIKELMVFLLHATNGRGDSAIRGMTRLQKLLFVIEKEIRAKSNFYAYNFGPFNEQVNDAEHALEVAGFISSSEPSSSGPPSFKEMVASVSHRATPSSGTKIFALSQKGHEAAERLRHSSPAYEQLFNVIEAVKKDWDTEDVRDLVARVYETWPQSAENSQIREGIERHSRKRRSE